MSKRVTLKQCTFRTDIILEFAARMIEQRQWGSFKEHS